MADQMTHHEDELEPGATVPGGSADEALGASDAVDADDVDLESLGDGATDDVEAVIRSLEQERDDANDGRLRALADFKNFQRRSEENEQRALASGTSRVVRSLLPVLDQFELALGSDSEQQTMEQFVDGVRLVRDEMLKAMATFNVGVINPQAGDEFDPNLHEAMVRQPSADVEPNAVLSTYQSGYVLGDQVLRPAKVVVAAPMVSEDDGE